MKTVTTHKIYIELLEAILQNAKYLIRASKILLNEHLKNREQNVGHIAQFLIFSSCDECGKFMIIKDLYPKALTASVLRKSGFYDHDKKWTKLIRYYTEQTGDFKYLAFYKTTSLNVAKFIREKIRESALFVNFVKGKVIKAGFIGNESFLKLVKTSASFIKLCEEELNKFRHTPILN